MNELVFQTSPNVTLATNTFINVPIILKFEDTNLIEIVREETLGFTTQIPIYHSDGTYLAKVKGTRIYPTDDGQKAGLKIDKEPNLWVCKMNGKTVFEIKQQSGSAFKTNAELYTPEGYFVKCSDTPSPSLIDMTGNILKIKGLILDNNTFRGSKVGVWLRKDGSCEIGLS